MNRSYAEGLIKFLDKSPSPFHVIENMENELEANGFHPLCENNKWELKLGESYYVTRNSSSIIAFRIPKDGVKGFQIMASHSDSPTLKVKTNPEIVTDNAYVTLNVEKYGGMICSPWFDRPLSVAGRVLVKNGNKVEEKFLDIDKDLLMIPNLAIHMNRAVNDGYSYNIQKDMLPLVSMGGKDVKFKNIVADALNVKVEDVVSMDLQLYNRENGRIWGYEDEFVSSRRLDDLECGYSSLRGILAAGKSENVAVHCVFDNEEVGSGTKQGAAGDFLKATLIRIAEGLGYTEADLYRFVSNSFMVSADNAHALHPNYKEKADPTNHVIINNGIVIKHSANQKYTTDAVSHAVFETVCQKAGVPTQNFLNRSDILGGSTLGNISTSQVSIKTVDIGLAQLAMHSCYETAGCADIEYLVKAAEAFFNSTITFDNNNFEVR